MTQGATGKLKLVFRSNGKQTSLAEQYYKLPLQVLPPHDQDGDGTAFVYFLNPSGGILSGDRLCTELLADDNASVVATTTSNNKIYKMDDGYAGIYNDFSVGDHAALEYLPLPTVPFAGSNLRQENIFRIRGSSVLFAWDILSPGRWRSNEIFAYDRFDSLTKIYRDGRLIVCEHILVEPGEKTLTRICVMESYLTSASVYLCARGIPLSLKDQIQQILRSSDLRGGMTFLDREAAAIRVVANDPLLLQEALDAIWTAFRKQVLGKDGTKIRRY
ncbi:MAG: urease accessory protein UreD [Clostridiales Family XIII bacterium]|jgi:urease accessory protein|nr:urease accessory protein UreD [Clostridiales Family XIII bacterium]